MSLNEMFLQNLQTYEYKHAWSTILPSYIIIFNVFTIKGTNVNVTYSWMIEG